LRGRGVEVSKTLFYKKLIELQIRRGKTIIYMSK
jgi:hypothetical protein